MTARDPTALLLSRIQFGFAISFHIIFPAFTIGLAAWLIVLEALHLRTGRPVYPGPIRILAQDIRRRLRPWGEVNRFVSASRTSMRYGALSATFQFTIPSCIKKMHMGRGP